MNQGGVSKALNQFQNNEHVKDTTNHTKIMDCKIFLINVKTLNDFENI